jgi:hypothetical protein
MKNLLLKLLAIKNNVPLVEKNIWYNRSLHMRDALPKVMEDGHYIEIDKERLYVLHELVNGKRAYYKITETHRSSGGDWLYDSDRYNVDFILVKIV